MLVFKVGFIIQFCQTIDKKLAKCEEIEYLRSIVSKHKQLCLLLLLSYFWWYLKSSSFSSYGCNVILNLHKSYIRMMCNVTTVENIHTWSNFSRSAPGTTANVVHGKIQNFAMQDFFSSDGVFGLILQLLANG